MANNILFVFEGEKTEKQINDNLTKFFLNENTIITCAYCSTIYQVYKEVSADEDLDTFSLLKSRNQNKVILEHYNSDDFAEIYMFFDYDGHDSVADDAKLKNLIGFFNEETDKGKLFISYPMIESLKHIEDYNSFKDLKVGCKENIYYKRLVFEGCLKGLVNITTYTLEIWKKLIDAHLKKMNYVVYNTYSLPNEIIAQLEIFDKQLEKYIEIDSTVGVLNSFPVFLHDYYGNEKLKSLIK